MSSLAEWTPATEAFGLFAAKLNINAISRTVLAWCRHSELRAHAGRIVAVTGIKEKHYIDEDVRTRDWTQCGDNWRFNWGAGTAVGTPDRETPSELHLYCLSFLTADLVRLGMIATNQPITDAEPKPPTSSAEPLKDWVRRSYANGQPWTVAWKEMQLLRKQGAFPNASRKVFQAEFAKLNLKLK